MNETEAAAQAAAEAATAAAAAAEAAAVAAAAETSSTEQTAAEIVAAVATGAAIQSEAQRIATEQATQNQFQAEAAIQSLRAELLERHDALSAQVSNLGAEVAEIRAELDDAPLLSVEEDDILPDANAPSTAEAVTVSESSPAPVAQAEPKRQPNLLVRLLLNQ